MKKRTYIIGSVSHGTMKNTDLLDSFSDALERLSTSNKDIIKKARRYRDFLVKYEDMLWKDHHKKMRDTVFETVSYIINEDLFNTLNELAPPHHYFGAHPGDGADYGFWLLEN